MTASMGLYAQFPGAAGTSNSTAIHKDSNIFSGWAIQCSIERGWLNISDKGAGKASIGNKENALGKPGQNGIVSLGDSGVAVVQFEQPIRNGPGADFAIFENSFSDFFLELAFVEVSSNGTDWVRFPATCNLSQDTQIGAFDETSDPTKLNNLAGKYRAQYGTPFDLEELKDSTRLNMDSVVYVKIIDAVGSIDPVHGQTDANGNRINDPFPTPFASGGFDLDAVGVIHQNVVKVSSYKMSKIKVYPNPLKQDQILNVEGISSNAGISIFDMEGRLRLETYTNQISRWKMPPGYYYVVIHDKDKSVGFKIVVSE